MEGSFAKADLSSSTYNDLFAAITADSSSPRFVASRLDYSNAVPDLGARFYGRRDGGLNGFLGDDADGRKDIKSKDKQKFALHFEGYIPIASKGTYTFSVASFDGPFQLKINDEVVAERFSFDRVDYFEGQPGSFLR